MKKIIYPLIMVINNTKKIVINFGKHIYNMYDVNNIFVSFHQCINSSKKSSLKNTPILQELVDGTKKSISTF